MNIQTQSINNGPKPAWKVIDLDIDRVIGIISFTDDSYYFINLNRLTSNCSRCDLSKATPDKIAEIVYHDFVNEFDPYLEDREVGEIDLIVELNPLRRMIVKEDIDFNPRRKLMENTWEYLICYSEDYSMYPEYWVLKVCGIDKLYSLMELGEEGWELASVTHDGERYIFKRRK